MNYHAYLPTNHHPPPAQEDDGDQRCCQNWEPIGATRAKVRQRYPAKARVVPGREVLVAEAHVVAVRVPVPELASEQVDGNPHRRRHRRRLLPKA